MTRRIHPFAALACVALLAGAPARAQDLGQGRGSLADTLEGRDGSSFEADLARYDAILAGEGGAPAEEYAEQLCELDDAEADAEQVNASLGLVAVGAVATAAPFTLVDGPLPFADAGVAAFVGAVLVVELGRRVFESRRSRRAARGQAATEEASAESGESGAEAGEQDGYENATRAGRMQREVERGQAPREVERVDGAHTPSGEPHVHYKDGTSSNRSGTTHDAHRGRPNPSRRTRRWLEGHGWTPPPR